MTTEWTEQPPTTPGYYWHKDFHDSVPEVLRIEEDDEAFTIGGLWSSRLTPPQVNTETV
jgi:hypothetical protein